MTLIKRLMGIGALIVVVFALLVAGGAPVADGAPAVSPQGLQDAEPGTLVACAGPRCSDGMIREMSYEEARAAGHPVSVLDPELPSCPDDDQKDAGYATPDEAEAAIDSEAKECQIDPREARHTLRTGVFVIGRPSRPTAGE